MLPGRVADTLVSLAAETPPRQPARADKERGRGPGGSRAEDLSVIPPPPHRLLFIRPVEMRARSAGSGDDVVINPEVANAPLPFT